MHHWLRGKNVLTRCNLFEVKSCSMPKPWTLPEKNWGFNDFGGCIEFGGIVFYSFRLYNSCSFRALNPYNLSKYVPGQSNFCVVRTATTSVHSLTHSFLTDIL